MTIEDLQPQELHEKVDSTEKKLNDLQKEVTDLSIVSKLRKKKDIEKELNTVKTDLEELKKNTNLSDTDKEKITQMEATNTELLASIQTELFDLKGDIENQGQDATRRQKNKTNVLIGTSTLGIGLLIMRWRRKRQERKAAENPDAPPPKKSWVLGILGSAAIGVGTFFGIKTVVGEERWGKFRNWLGLKDKEEDNEDEEETETINENLTAEEVQKRNEYIEKSIKASTTMPITIDYGTDKDAFEKKGCPKTISFDQASQSILLGDKDKITLKTDKFTLEGKSVISSRFEKIEQVDGKFEVTMKTGVVNGYTPMLESKKVTMTKDEFIAILSPYYTEQKTEYTVQLNNNGQTIPLHVGASRETQSNTDENPDASFERLNPFKKGQYTKFGNSINNYYKTLYSMNNEYGQQSDLLGAGAEDDEKFEQKVGAIPAMMDQKFDNVGDIVKDTMLERVKNIGDITTEKMAEFLDKYKDNPTFGKVMGKISGFLTDLFSRGGIIDTTKLEEVFKSDPATKKKVSIVIWKMSKIKGYLVDQQDRLVNKIKEIHPSFSDAEQKAELKKIYLDLKIVGESSSSDSALKTLERYGLLNSINEDREFTVKAQKAAADLQTQIEATPTPSDRDAETIADRGKIEYEPRTQRIRSRGVSTEVEIVSRGSDSVYKLKNRKIGLDIEFTSISELVWTANFLNRSDYTYKKNILKEYGHRGANMVLPDMLKFYSPKFEFVNTNVHVADNVNNGVIGTTYNATVGKIPIVGGLIKKGVKKVSEAVGLDGAVRTVVGGSVSTFTGIKTQADLLGSRTRSTGVMSKDQIEKNAPSLLPRNHMDALLAFMHQRMAYYDPLDDFWGKMKRMGGNVVEGIENMIQNAIK